MSTTEPQDGPVVHDVAVIGAGPAGLSAALNLVRAKRTVLLVDANRPRNAATLRSHGFLTRDGISPLELRKLGRTEVEGYPEATVVQSVVDLVTPDAAGWRLHGAWRGTQLDARARAVVVATGLREEFPALPTLRAFYGTSVHSCVECDAYDKAGEPLAFICETDDVVDRALLVAAWTDDLVVYTNGVARVDDAGRARLAAAGVVLDERRVEDLEGDRTGMTGVRLADGHVEPRSGGFVRPTWHADLDWLQVADGPDDRDDTPGGRPLLRRDADGLLVVDRVGRTSVPGLYAVGDVTPPGPEQLIVAAGHGAATAAAVHRDLVGGLTDLRDAVQ
ncbi:MULTISPECIES: NAD(P)/FAD-dependent oxidoreductase [unclassified Curtobacterium]|uniref:NAD(P)/FAD-dependent oxidoreductase n=1 Tax=unclassified Curtobacterium TaxID=257496 RepID=UPI0008DD6904|nr:MULTISPECIES: NAD(P)/FAD-dependent oxidoreductase [unclassified Curtobacterium]OIH97122.1 pyridine nucleotide-disulfide oxidoreductase [Curtobacterium sp. MCBA15_003]OII15103.1 pyridine nucleotide-disulfide oxidoreductase [Curtobacterium sp. MCBA15_009]OII32984.1 pyridine nucleotide-disulfide oxidoreductase [Curtobacterium sp. MMLR14_006]